MIPVYIHQTWKNYHVPFDVYRKEWVESWQRFHPDCIYKLWTDEALQVLAGQHFVEMLPIFADGDTPGVVKADFGRLMAVWRYGGVYADLDYRCLKNLCPILQGDNDRDFVASAAEGSKPGYIHNAFFAARARHPLLGGVLHEGLRRWKEDKARQVEDIAGPGVFGPMAAAYAKVDPRTYVAPPSLLCPHSWNTKQTAALGNVPEDVLEHPEQVYPDAFAITYWRHFW